MRVAHKFEELPHEKALMGDWVLQNLMLFEIVAILGVLERVHSLLVLF